MNGMNQNHLKKVVIVGPESTGKSTLCELLARHYHTLWCPEYARDYLVKYGMDYKYEDLLTIAKGQLQLEDQYAQMVNNQWSTKKEDGKNDAKGPVLFVDTDMYVMKVWCEFVFGRCHQFILDAITQRSCDVYLLCNIDLPWAFDPLREYPTEQPRKELFRMYKDILINQEVPWVEISGSYEQRLQLAIGAVEQYCFPKK